MFYRKFLVFVLIIFFSIGNFVSAQDVEIDQQNNEDNEVSAFSTGLSEEDIKEEFIEKKAKEVESKNSDKEQVNTATLNDQIDDSMKNNLVIGSIIKADEKYIIELNRIKKIVFILYFVVAFELLLIVLLFIQKNIKKG